MFRLSLLYRVCSVILIVAVSASCAPAAMPTPKPALNVLAAETFLADVAHNVAGNRLKVNALMPVGVDPHGFQPTPSDVKKVADSQVLIINGAGVEEFLDELLKNAGSQRAVIEASAGLKGREAKEGEQVHEEMSDADLVKAMCEAAAGEKPQNAQTGRSVEFATELPAEEGLFEVSLVKQADGTYGGYFKYVTDEAGDFQIALGAGKVSLAKVKDKAEVEIEKTVALAQPPAGKCAELTQGNVVELEKGDYLAQIAGVKDGKVRLLIGPLGGHGVHHHHEGDPHFWLDPNLVVKYVENIRDGLSQADPDGAKTYAANAEAYIKQLQELDQWIVEQVKQVPDKNRQLVTNHESFGYFADRYGFKIVGTIIPSVSTGASPSAKELAQLTAQVKQAGVKAIFLETGANPQMAKQLAQETGIKVVTELYTHSVTEAEGAAPTYVDMIKYNVKAIVDALK